MKKEHAYIKNGAISSENIVFYKTYGYLVALSLLSGDEVDELKKETAAIFRGKRGSVKGMLEVGENETDADVLKKYVAIHFPHKISPSIHAFLWHKKIIEVLVNIVSPNVKCMQSMLFVKGPGKAGQAWHQDEFYIPTRDRSLAGVWIAIDNASIENGC